MDDQQYVSARSGAEHDLEAARRRFEGLRREYDAADSGERPALESDLKKAQRPVETARERLAQIEAQFPQYDAAYAIGDPHAQERAKAGLDDSQKRFEGLRRGYDAAELGERPALEPGLREAAGHVEAAREQAAQFDRRYGAPSRNVKEEIFEAVETGIDAFEEHREAAHGVASALSSQADSGRMGEIALGLASLLNAATPHGQTVDQNASHVAEGTTFYERQAEDLNFSEFRFEFPPHSAERHGHHEDDHTKQEFEALARSRGGPKNQWEKDAEGLEVKGRMNRFEENIDENILAGKDYREALREATKDLYADLTGREYRGQVEDLKSAVGREMETKYGNDARGRFEQAYEAHAARLQQEQRRERTHGHGHEQTL